jgi:hypothetical protein
MPAIVHQGCNDFDLLPFSRALPIADLAPDGVVGKAPVTRVKSKGAQA